MKKLTFLFLLLFPIAETQAQNFLLAFSATGASSIVDSVIVKNLTQCTETRLGGSDTLHLSATIGINELNTAADNTLHTYPNPCYGNCSIDFEATAAGVTRIVLFDIVGKRILQAQEFLTKGHHTFSLSGIGSGIYTLEIVTGKYLYTSKIISNSIQTGFPGIKHIETKPVTNKPGTVLISVKKKGDRSVIDMQYNTGDILKLTGKSDIYRTVYMLVPWQSETVTFNFVACNDADNNHYAVVQIGSQIWMAENLKTTKYRNGASIPNVTDGTAWSMLGNGAYCNYNNTSNIDTINTYGRLYNWYAAADMLNIAPLGWHVSADSEWTELSTYLGGDNISGGKLKETCTTLWTYPNNASNESGFSALPGGRRTYYGAFMNMSDDGNWWTSTTSSTNPSWAWYRGLHYLWISLATSEPDKTYGFSVRCVKD